MPILPLALPTKSNQSRDAWGGVAALINCYAIQADESEKAPLQVWAAAGLDGVTTISTTGGVRGMMEVDGVVLAVIGRTLQSIDTSGAATLLGGIPSDGYIGMARNQRASGTQTTIVGGGSAWVVVNGNSQRITDPDLPAVADCCTINRSTIFATTDGRMFRSEIDDSASVDGLNIEEAESAPDGLLRVVDRGSDLLAFGSRSIEVWSDIGGEAFGFARRSALTVGLLSQSSLSKATVLQRGQPAQTVVVFLGTSSEGQFAGVFVLQGDVATKISDDWADRMIAAVADNSTITATNWIESGRSFVAFRLPSTTIVYDTGTWQPHERQSRTSREITSTWRISHCVGFNGKVLAGHATEPRLYWLDPAMGDEDGDEHVWIVRTPPVHAFPGRIEMSGLYLDVVTGVGLASGSVWDIAPEIALSMSRDGRLWGASRMRSLGIQGDYGRQVYWSRLGSFDMAAYELRCSANVVRGVLSARWEGKALPP